MVMKLQLQNTKLVSWAHAQGGVLHIVPWPQRTHNLVPRLNLEEKWPDLCIAKFKLFTSAARNRHNMMSQSCPFHCGHTVHWSLHHDSIGILYNPRTFVWLELRAKLIPQAGKPHSCARRVQNKITYSCAHKCDTAQSLWHYNCI